MISNITSFFKKASKLDKGSTLKTPYLDYVLHNTKAFKKRV